jgi:anti-anti-sigma regulatory factor
MEKFDIRLHKPGVVIYRAKGNLSTDDVEKWREELLKFVKENDKRGACGVLIDVCAVESFSAEGLDALMELLADPEEIIRNMHMRFALIGVKPFTQRFLRETMPLEEIKHIRGRFFHEVAEEEALAWLQAMVSTAEEQTDPKQAEPVKKEATEPQKEETRKPPEPSQSKEAEKKPDEKAPDKKEPEKKEPDKKEPEKKEPDKKPEPIRLIPTLLKGRIKPEEKK